MRRKRIITIWLCTILLICGIFPFDSILTKAKTSEGNDHNETVVKVACMNIPNFLYKENDEYKGFAYEYLTIIQKYTKWKFEYVEMDWTQADQALKDGTVDLVPGCMKTKERNKYCDYSDQTFGFAGTLLCTTKDNNQAYENDFQRYQDYRIGIVSEPGRVKGAQEEFARQRINPAIVTYDTDAKLKQALRKGEIDAMLIGIMQMEDSYKILASFDSDKLYLGVSKKSSQLLVKLNYAMKTIKQANIGLMHELFQKTYRSCDKNFAFNKGEIAYINNKKEVNVACCKNSFPLEYVDENGNYCGVVKDVFDFISARTGLKFHFQLYDTPEEQKQAFMEGKAEILSILLSNKSWEDTNSAVPSVPFLNCSTTRIYWSEENSQSTRYQTIALVAGSGLSSRVAREFDQDRIKYYATAEACMDAVYEKKVSCTYLKSPEANYYLMQSKYYNLKYTSQADLQQVYAVGLRKNGNKNLYSLINKVVRMVPSEFVTNSIENNSKKKSDFQMLDMIYAHPEKMFAIFFVIVLLVTALIICAVLYYINRRRNVVLERVEQTKSRFLARMSHEIRTPITAIIGMNDIARENLKNDQVVEDCMGKIDVASKHLLDLINEILDMTKMGEGKIHIINRPFSLKEMLHTIEVVYAEFGREKDIQFQMEVDDFLEDHVIGDQLRVRQIIINLLSNAFKYNKPKGTVKLQVRADVKTDREELVSFLVSDTGIGIAKDHLDQIFDVFERENEVEESQIAGTGLGLAICRQLAELMQGSLTVTSEQGAGSTFAFQVCFEIDQQYQDLPEPAKDSETEEKTDQSIAGKKILIAEDNPVNVKIEQYILTAQNVQTVVASDGDQTCEILEHSQPYEFDAVLLDIQLPGKTGFEVAKYVRQLKRDDMKSIPLIGVSALSPEECKEREGHENLDAYLAKPIDRDIMVKTISDLCEKRKK